MATDMNAPHDFIVVGAGPVGLSLAIGLCCAGKSVLVLEKNESLSEHSKAAVIWPGTLEVLAEIGVIDHFLAVGECVSELKLWNADGVPERPLVSLPLKNLADETKFPFVLILPQSKTEALLLDALKTYPSAEIKFSCEVISLNEGTDGVEFTYREAGAEKKTSAYFGIGCDGAHSAVRHLLGFSLQGFTYSLRAALADIRLNSATDFKYPRVSTRELPAIGIKIEPDLWRLILPYGVKESLDLDERIKTATKNLFSEKEFSLIWKSDFKLHQRISTAFSKGRVVLAGDAAHLNSPVGGQGMNAGIQDTRALRNALLQALETNSEAPIEKFSKTRRREIRSGVNQFTNFLTVVLTFGNGRFLKFVMRTMNQFLKIKPIRHRFIRRVAMLNSER